MTTDWLSDHCAACKTRHFSGAAIESFRATLTAVPGPTAPSIEAGQRHRSSPRRTPRHLLSGDTELDRRVWHFLLTRAAALGFREDDLEECAVTFAERMHEALATRRWQAEASGTPLLQGPRFEGWLFACARNHVFSLWEKRRRRESREAPPLDALGDSLAGGPPSYAQRSGRPLPEDAALLTELRTILLQALREAADPESIEMLLEHEVDGKTVQEIAREHHLTPAALYKRIPRTQEKVQRWLQQQGYGSEREIREYLPRAQASPCAGPGSSRESDSEEAME